MAFCAEKLSLISDRTDGCCHLSGKRPRFGNYGGIGARGAWEVEHSVARANGATDHGSNLFAACIGRNRQKGVVTTRTARAWNGRKRAPLSRDRKEVIRRSNGLAGGAAALIFGGLIAGPAGAVFGAPIGTAAGFDSEPD